MTGSGVGIVVDVTLGNGVTLFGVQPVLRAAVSLEKLYLNLNILNLWLFNFNLIKTVKIRVKLFKFNKLI